MIFLDNASTTPCYKAVADKFAYWLSDNFFNPSAPYFESLEVKKSIEQVRKNLLSLINAEDEVLTFCGSASEANNMAICSGLSSGKQLVISSGEHPSVYECAKNLKNKGVDVVFLPLDSNGKVDEDAYKSLDFSNVGLISIMHVSNETGAINDIKKLVKIAKSKNSSILFHSDGVQAFGKIGVDFSDLGVDYYTISAHKIHGPKGIGALISKRKAKLQPIIFGGGQENGKRSGTENVASIMAFDECVKIKLASEKADYEEIQKVKSSLIEELKQTNLPIVFNSNLFGSPYILSFSVEGLRGEVLVHALEEHQILCGTGSACSTKKIENRILQAMGRTQRQIEGNIRISFSVSQIGLDTKFIAQKVALCAQKLIK